MSHQPNARMDYAILYNVFHWIWHTNLLECDVINHQILEAPILFTSSRCSHSTEINDIAKEFAIVLSAFPVFKHFQVVSKFKCFRYQWVRFATDIIIIINFKLQSVFVCASSACWVAIQEGIKRNILKLLYFPLRSLLFFKSINWSRIKLTFSIRRGEIRLR